MVAREEAPGFYMQTGYRLPRSPLPAGATPKPEDLVPVTWLNVKSLITWPDRDAALARERHTVRGVAWTGQGHVTSVEFSTDRDPRWRPAVLATGPRPGSWRQFRVDWEPREAGRHILRVRHRLERRGAAPDLRVEQERLSLERHRRGGLCRAVGG